jgi:hypothetical protein
VRFLLHTHARTQYPYARTHVTQPHTHTHTHIVTVLATTCTAPNAVEPVVDVPDSPSSWTCELELVVATLALAGGLSSEEELELVVAVLYSISDSPGGLELVGAVSSDGGPPTVRETRSAREENMRSVSTQANKRYVY